MLVHGHYNYRRQVNLAQYMVYKGFVLVLPAFLFQFWSLFSGQEMYEFTAYQMFNTLFTSLPIIVYGVWDQDADEEVIYENPELYSIGQNDEFFNASSVAVWTFAAAVHGLLIFFVPLLSSAHRMPLFEFGVFIFSGVVVVVDLRVVTMMGRLRWHWFTWFITIGSVVLYFVFELYVDSEAFSNLEKVGDYTHVAHHTFDRVSFWMGSFLLVGSVSVLTSCFWHSWYIMFPQEEAAGNQLLQKVLERQIKLEENHVDDHAAQVIRRSSAQVYSNLWGQPKRDSASIEDPESPQEDNASFREPATPSFRRSSATSNIVRGP